MFRWLILEAINGSRFLIVVFFASSERVEVFFIFWISDNNLDRKYCFSLGLEWSAKSYITELKKIVSKGIFMLLWHDRIEKVIDRLHLSITILIYMVILSY